MLTRFFAALLACSVASCRAVETTPATIASTPDPGATAGAAPPDDDEAPSDEDLSRLREHVIRERSAKLPDTDPARSPEAFAGAMKGVVACDKKRCRAGREVCVVSPSPAVPAQCEPIASWVDHRTPRPRDGFPPLGGITACSGSNNCPEATVCCLHEIGAAEVQAVVCHADLGECRDHRELCSGGLRECRTPGTVCQDYVCVAR